MATQLDPLFTTPTLEAQAIRRTRILISGGPGTWKTGSLLTTPAPRHILSFPGEKGYDTLPVDDPETLSYIFKEDLVVDALGTPKSRTPSAQVLNSVKSLTVKILAGHYGQVHTFCGDGLHKLYPYFLDDASGGKFFQGEEIEGRDYGNATIAFMTYVTMVCQSQVPVVVFTVWDAPEKDRPVKPGETSQTYKLVDSHLYPDLPGKLAKRILGEFSVVCGAYLAAPKPGEKPIGMWRLRPAGETWGVGVKVPPSIANKIPDTIPASYPILEKVLAGQYQAPTQPGPGPKPTAAGGK